MGFLKRNILAVDDDPATCKLLEAMLTQSGYFVSFASDSFQALEMLHKYAYDLLILDILLPKVSGLDFLKRLRSSEKAKTLPVIMLSSKDDRPTIEKALQFGANDYLIKPPNKEKLVTKIENLLGGRPRFAEVEFTEKDIESQSELVFPIKIVSIGESGVVIQAPLALEPEELHLIRSPLFTKIGIESPCLRVIQNQVIKSGYLNYFSYVGLSDEEVAKLREWVVQTQLTKKKSA